MFYVFTLFVAFAVVAPLFFIGYRVKKGKSGKAPLIANIVSFFGILALGAIYCIAQVPAAFAAEASTTAANAANSGISTGLGYLSAALAVGIPAIGGGFAVSTAASAALGAISENEKVFGKALIFVGLAEGIALYGLLIGLLIVTKL